MEKKIGYAFYAFGRIGGLMICQIKWVRNFRIIKKQKDVYVSTNCNIISNKISITKRCIMMFEYTLANLLESYLNAIYVGRCRK
jgi:hypothetical protein